MEQLIGKGVCGGVRVGPLYYLERRPLGASRRRVDDVPGELARFERAQAEAVAQLGELHQEALAKVGEAGAALFEVHQMMVEDLDYSEAVRGVIETQEANAEYAVTATGKNFAQLFAQMDDPYMNARSADVLDVSARLVSILTGQPLGGIDSEAPVILATDDLTPSETVQLDESKILAFVTAGGSTNSHTAILARSLGIPALVQVGPRLTSQWHGRRAAVDGQTGRLYIEPDAATLTELGAKAEAARRHQTLLQELKGLPSRTQDGREVELFANVNGLGDLALALTNDAAGIGLFRTEFVFLEADDYPDEEAQFKIYKQVAQTMAGKKVVFRTMDIGADKQIDYFDLAHEDNPALGLRGARLSLDRPQLLRAQLRALYRASAYGAIAIMFPMIASPWEVEALTAAARAAAAELTAEGVDVAAKVELGIMIETPAAALIADQLAPLVDFFSIGSNDLTQYTLAVDRQNDAVDRFCDTHHAAVLKLIELAARAAHAHGRWIGICGELGADPTLTETFLRLGIDELSVSPAKVLELRHLIRSLDLS
ncbi:MAG: phosphoenolpyruvate--protein phosphotransferase [Propionibacteriaceae bacterium]|jgi:phosphotransferase system enzyme I (PtsI)|nr:phosphoenolpyruvate--protein phosphotransferase [Propionibacteriaceae bacterium]